MKIKTKPIKYYSWYQDDDIHIETNNLSCFVPESCGEEVVDLMKMAYEAGKNGEEFIIEWWYK